MLLSGALLSEFEGRALCGHALLELSESRPGQAFTPLDTSPTQIRSFHASGTDAEPALAQHREPILQINLIDGAGV